MKRQIKNKIKRLSIKKMKSYQKLKIMKYIVGFSRLFVGILFIISGLIKLNDPIGFAFKLDEYFGPTVLDLPFLIPYALAISIFVVIFEVVLGIFLLIGYKPKFTVWSLLLMIVFFTFLTFYSAYFNKVKDCGCFGDALKLTPWESFTKDIVLLFFIVILFFGVKHIKPLFSKLGLTVVSLLSFIGCLAFAYHVLMHLPAKDFRPYKVGDNIMANMTVPDDAPEAIIEYSYKFNVDGKEQIIVTNGSYPTVDGEFVGVETKTIRDAYEPPIHDFSIERDEQDYTTEILEKENLIVIVSYSLEIANAEGLQVIKGITDKAIKNGYNVLGLTATGPDTCEDFKKEFDLNFDFYFCDETALKTIIRSNPGILKLHKGTILQKLHFNDADDLELPEVERTPEPIEVEEVVENILYLINGEQKTKEEVDALLPETIEAVNIISDSIQKQAITTEAYDKILSVELKK
jgi:uncharacterized membrane protein YphA (DoxX/SURF4 family)